MCCILSYNQRKLATRKGIVLYENNKILYETLATWRSCRRLVGKWLRVLCTFYKVITFGLIFLSMINFTSREVWTYQKDGKRSSNKMGDMCSIKINSFNTKLRIYFLTNPIHDGTSFYFSIVIIFFLNHWVDKMNQSFQLLGNLSFLEVLSYVAKELIHLIFLVFQKRKLFTTKTVSI